MRKPVRIVSAENRRRGLLAEEELPQLLLVAAHVGVIHRRGAVDGPGVFAVARELAESGDDAALLNRLPQQAIDRVAALLGGDGFRDTFCGYPV